MQHEPFVEKIDPRPLFEMLKQGTTDLHRKIESLLPVFRNDFTLQQYKNFLMRLLGFYIPIEDHIADFFSHRKDMFEMQTRKKVPLLIADLLALGTPMHLIYEVPICAAIKEIDTMPEMVGVLYALEHMTLEEQIIAKKLKEHLPLADNQLQYYSAYGKHTYEMWYQFRALSESLIQQNEKEIAVTRARATFIKFKNWMKMNEIQV